MRLTRHLPLLPACLPFYSYVVPEPKGLQGRSPLSHPVLVIGADFLLLTVPKADIWPSLISHLFQRSSTFMTPETGAPVRI